MTLDIAGRRYGGFIALRRTKKRRRGSYLWIFRCDGCGRVYEKDPRDALRAAGCQACHAEDMASSAVSRRLAVRDLRSQGKTFTEIGRLLGVSKQRVCQIASGGGT